MQQVDDPPYLTVGTEVSAKYKGAFCEAKVRKVVRNIKCKVAYKQGLGSGTVSDDQIKCELLRVGATVEVKHPDRRELVEATITKIQDYSQYTVVFDDGDITTLRRSALCLKSGRHFNESETLDQLPLTHPEHFGNPVIGGRRGRSLELYKKSVARSRQGQTPDESSEEDEEPEAVKPRIVEKEEHIGKIVCVESTDTKKKGPKENWFPALVVAPTAQDTVRIRVKEEYLVRSFKDGRYYTVPKKEATEFTPEQASKLDTPAVAAALEYSQNDCLPAHWDREVLFGLGNSSSDFYNEFDSDTSDDEPTEEKDHFVAQLYKYMDDRGTPLNKGPSIINKDVDLYRLYRAVQKLGGYNRVTSQNQWKQIAIRLGFVPTTTSIQNLVKQAYKKFLLPFEEFDRKLGCSMVAHPRANRIKGRSLVRANSVASPKPEKEAKSTTSAAEESENTSESSIDTKPKTKVVGKVKSLVDRYEEKTEENKRDLKDVKEKETNRKDKDVASSSKTDVPVTPTTKKEKTNKKQVTPQVDEKKGRKKGKDNENSEKIKLEPDDGKEKIDTVNVQPINVGDKLRVYYHEQKVTYEAKVIEISHDQLMYLVHYTGWNTRYDEWVPKERIAENLTNSKTNKRSKAGVKNEPRSGSSTSEKLPGPSPVIRSSSKRNRVSSRGDSQPPRSTTPSSIASNSSRTKSPATPAQQRRTTRGQPGKLRRNSNNTDISSLQTDSDSDSDEPVVKKPTPSRIIHLKRKPVFGAKAKAKREAVIEAIEIKKEKDSNPSSEEETLASTAAKSRGEFELNQMRSALKGFNDIEKTSIESNVSSSATMVEKKFDYIPKVEPIEISNTTTATISNTTNVSTSITSRTKISPQENSSETDSYGDEDSQFSDKTTTLENVSDKFNKFLFDKNATSNKHEMVATLKQSGIEKIIKSTLAEKQKLLPEKSMMKTLGERAALKDVEKKTEKDTSDEKDAQPSTTEHDDKETAKEIKTTTPVTSGSEQISVVTVKVEMDRKSGKVMGSTVVKPLTQTTESKSEIIKTTKPPEEENKIETPSQTIPTISSPQPTNQEKSTASESIVDTEVTVKVEVSEKSVSTSKQIFADKSKPFNKSALRQPLVAPKEETKTTESGTDASSSNSSSASSTTTAAAAAAAASTCDIYEFKEPELFEFETSKKLSPETDKKAKRKTQTESIKPPPSLSTPTLSPLSTSSSSPPSVAPAKRTKKLSKEPEKAKESDDQKLAKPIASAGSVFNVRGDLIFDTLRKSPCYMPDQVDEEMMMNEDCPSTSEAIPVQQLQSEIKPLFINSFVDATPEETSKIFDLKSGVSDFKEDLEKELESVKKILLSDEVLNQEPPKIDKPSSIADKVLKALHSQQQLPASLNAAESSSVETLAATAPAAAEATNEADPADIVTPITVDVMPKALTTFDKSVTPSTSTAAVSCGESAMTSTRASSSYRAGISPNTETTTIKPVLNKIDILESISPKNNDLSETIQKLESAIQKSGEHTHMSEDTSDSTDSEQRLIIEDESQSSETPNEFVLSKQESDQSYGGKQISKEKTSTTITVISSVSDKKIYGFDEKELADQSIATMAAVAATAMAAEILPTPSSSSAQPSSTSVVITATSNVTNTIASTESKVSEEPSSISSNEQTTTIKTDEPADKVKIEDELAAENAQNESISLLLCEETIPGSPAPAYPKEQCDLIKKNYDSIFTSPLTVAEVDAKHVPTESSTSATTDAKQNKSKNATPRSSPRDSLSQEDSSEENNKKQEHERIGSSKKRRCTRKQSEAEAASKRRKAATRRNTQTGSESEDNSDAITTHKVQRPSKSHQYNFLVQLDPDMNSSQRITLLKKKIQDLRKTYIMVKTELASIDRRRKKLRRREREMKKNVQKQLQQQLQQQQNQQILVQVENHPTIIM
ncbi:AT-rich interactive domain-containing protein 4B [Contarinia nasturtii]|uniref:AT-rich interactive domain-containing protein 4B n=1 Tax=Contarinia nasturtii TaxID=265458 RepID=UPI0012D386CE|nr:AT-rich interactive domain-containing protein 4B [Contarinia nasturtii]